MGPELTLNRDVQLRMGVFFYPWRFCQGMLKSTAKIHPRFPGLRQIGTVAAPPPMPSRGKDIKRRRSGGALPRARGGKEVYKGHLDNGCIGGMP